MTVEQLRAFCVVDGVRFTLQGNGFGSAARIEAHSEIDPNALDEALEMGLLRMEYDRGRPRFRRHFSNQLRAFNAMLHIQRLDQKWRPSFFAETIETCIEVDRLLADQPVLGWSRARKLMLEAMPECAFCGLTEPLEVHHIHGRKGHNPHRLTNLITLCCNHHKEAEKHRLPMDLERRWVQVVTAERVPVEYR